VIAVWRVFLIGLSLLLVWRIAAVGMSQHLAELAVGGDPGAAQKALAWHGSHPDALLRHAQENAAQDASAAAAQARAAYLASPSQPQPLLALARSATPDTAPETAEAYIRLATQLAPASGNVAVQGADYWLRRGDLAKAMGHWSRALEAEPSQSKTLFPILLRIAEDPQGRSFFADAVRNPPRWWTPFFSEVARRALDLETVRALYALRRDAATSPLPEDERNAYIARLQREGQATEAYLAWVNGLDETRRRHLGLLFNGGFEVDLTDAGFDWRRARLKGSIISTAKTYGTEGERSLHLLFQGTQGPFRHLTQDLYVQPGHYRLLGKVRPDGLKGTGGLQWAVRCGPSAAPVATSERFLGSGQWRDFSFSFELPPACEAPQLVLVSVGERPSDHDLSGAIWFDTLKLRATRPPTPDATPTPAPPPTT